MTSSPSVQYIASARGETRTRGPFHVREVLSPLSYARAVKSRLRHQATTGSAKKICKSSEPRDSNPYHRFGGPRCCRYTTFAFSFEIQCIVLTNHSVEPAPARRCNVPRVLIRVADRSLRHFSTTLFPSIGICATRDQ